MQVVAGSIYITVLTVVPFYACSSTTSKTTQWLKSTRQVRFSFSSGRWDSSQSTKLIYVQLPVIFKHNMESISKYQVRSSGSSVRICPRGSRRGGTRQHLSTLVRYPVRLLVDKRGLPLHMGWLRRRSWGNRTALAACHTKKAIYIIQWTVSYHDL